MDMWTSKIYKWTIQLWTSKEWQAKWQFANRLSIAIFLSFFLNGKSPKNLLID